LIADISEARAHGRPREVCPRNALMVSYDFQSAQA
jgi:hypothetical protein